LVRDKQLKVFHPTLKIARFSLVLDPTIRDPHSFKLKRCKINNNNTIVKLISIINITIRFISISNTITKMSDSSLSPPPQSEISLPTLPPLLSPTLQLCHTAKMLRLVLTNSNLFTSSLFSYALLETTLPTLQLCCLQPRCLYALKPQLLTFNQTSNY
jgi:hypothetical protein